MSDYLFQDPAPSYPTIYAQVIQVSPQFWFSDCNFVWTLHLPQAYQMSCPSHSPQYDHPVNIQYRVQIMKLLIIKVSQPLHIPVTSSLNTLLSTLFTNTINPHSSLRVRDQGFHPYKQQIKIIILYILIFRFLHT